MDFKMITNSNDKSITKEDINSFSTETLKCQVCGYSYPKNIIGRTREYCSPNCQEFNKFKNAMVERMKKIDFLDIEARTIRRELWGYCNYAKISKKKEFKC
jgi:hypothetical protein